MRKKYYDVVMRMGPNINKVMTRIKQAHLRSINEFKFNDQNYKSDSTEQPWMPYFAAGLVVGSAIALQNTADSEEPLDRKKYSRNAYLTNMETLISTHYPRISNLPEDILTLIIEQLDWVQQNTEFTPQASVIYDASDNKVNISNHLNREILRALTRIEMLLLVAQTDFNNPEEVGESYKRFTKDQRESEKLSYKDFCQLLGEFQISESELDAQIRAVLIGAATLSPIAKAFLAQTQYAKQYPYDSVQFSGFTVTLVPTMYPAYTRASTEVQRLIHFAFPNDKQHWRHMFYLENNSAFQDFERANLSADSLSFWKRYWLINAFGFNGHIKMDSAVFFDDSVALRANLLHEAMDIHLRDFTKNTAVTYANLCAKHLEINANEDEALLLTRVMTMTNLMTPVAASNMYTALHEYPDREALLQLHKQTFKSDILVTYLPALLFNVWSIRQKASDVIAAFHWANKIIPSFTHNNPLSFRTMTRSAVEILIASQFSETSLVINEKGEVSARELPPLGFQKTSGKPD